jgi:hypothetical protein
MRRAAILITSLVIAIFAGCNFYLDDDDKDGRGHPQSGTPDAGYGDQVPDAGCGNDNHGDADGGFIPDGGYWPDAGFWPDASPW